MEIKSAACCLITSIPFSSMYFLSLTVRWNPALNLEFLSRMRVSLIVDMVSLLVDDICFIIAFKTSEINIHACCTSLLFQRSTNKRTQAFMPIEFYFSVLYNRSRKVKEETEMTFLILLFLFYAVLCILGKF